MSEQTGQFHAKDAFVYVDYYRSSIRKQVALIRDELEVKQKRLWENKELPKHFYAELRALEDALKHATKGDEPGWVIMGDPASITTESGCDPQELETCQKNYATAVEDRLKVEQQVKQASEYIQELKAAIIQQRQEMVILQRRLEQNSSTFMVVLATMFLVIVVQLYMLWRI